MISTKQVLELGISKQTLSNYVRSGKIERVGSGIYMLPDMIEDDMYALSLHSKWIIFSHDTALFLNHLAERTPFSHSITIPSNASVPKSMKRQCSCHYVKPELHLLGATVRKTTFGHEVPCYNLERTICDLIRSRSRYSVELITDAIKAYAASSEKDLNHLSEYAEQFHVAKALKPYLEVLL
jgi:predicted transcriptional regulator of viral defense system